MILYTKMLEPVWYSPIIKAVQVTFDEALLERFDREPAVRRRGRSAVLREAAVEYLERREAEEIARRYRAGYRDPPTRDDELGDWSDEAAWPES